MFAIPSDHSPSASGPAARQGLRYGRFLQADPIGYASGMNLYAYVKGDPVNLTDRSGTAPDCGLESNWRSGNCADNAVAYEVRQTAEANGYSDSEMLAATAVVLDFLYGHLGYAATALGLLQIEEGVAAKQGAGSACPGRFQCEATPTQQMRRELIQLLQNTTFVNSVRYVEQQSRRTGTEWGFTGKGRGNFSLVGSYIQGAKDAIDERVIAARVSMGADLFFHIHPNLSTRYFPGLSYGRQNMLLGGDLGIAYNNGILVGAWALKTKQYYWFDGRGLKR